jgi:hypothetical protein
MVTWSLYTETCNCPTFKPLLHYVSCASTICELCLAQSLVPITVYAWTLVASSNTGIVGSNPTQSMVVCLRLFCVCTGSSLATGWSPVQGILPIVLGLKNWSETKRFTDTLCRRRSNRKTRGREKFSWNCNQLPWLTQIFTFAVDLSNSPLMLPASTQWCHPYCTFL